MNWILYAGYEDPDQAVRAFGSLLESGVASEDLAVLLPAKRSPGAERQRIRWLVDSAQAHLEEIRLGIERMEEEGLPDVESEIGGGIETITADDDVSGVEEMDEASEVAERMAEPLDERPYGSDDLHDALQFAQKGTLDVTKPPTPGFSADRPAHPRKPVDRPYSVEVFDGVLIVGDGPLATIALSTELGEQPSDAVDTVRTSLHRAGVAASEAAELAETFRNGGAVLAVTETPGKVPLHKIEAFVEASGGRAVREFLERSD